MNVTMNIFIICISPSHHITITAGPCRAVAWWSTVESLSWCLEAPFAGGSTLYAISDRGGAGALPAPDVSFASPALCSVAARARDGGARLGARRQQGCQRSTRLSPRLSFAR